MGRAVGLLDAVKSATHSHRDLRHPQTGNPFSDWWMAARFRCPLCLAVMAADGTDVALEFTHQLPFRVEHDFDVRWWKDAYLATLPYVADNSDREWIREGLARALRHGKEHRDAAARDAGTTGRESDG